MVQAGGGDFCHPEGIKLFSQFGMARSILLGGQTPACRIESRDEMAMRGPAGRMQVFKLLATLTDPEIQDTVDPVKRVRICLQQILVHWFHGGI